MKEKSPAFQFYPKDWLSDANVLKLTAAGRGGYIQLLAIAWLEGSLPADLEELRRLSCLTPKQFSSAWHTLQGCFVESPTEPGRLVHPRLEVERESQAEFRESQAAKGRASGEARRKRKAGSDWEPGLNRGSAGVEPEANSPSPISDLPPPPPTPPCDCPGGAGGKEDSTGADGQVDVRPLLDRMTREARP